MDRAGSDLASAVESVSPKGLVEVMCHMKRILIFAFLFPFAQACTANIGTAFMRSIVHCDPPVPDKWGQCPSGSFFNLGHCEAAPRGSRDWSFSSYCADRAFVVITATATSGKMVLAAQAAQIVGVAVLGPQLDIWGRKPLTLLAAVAYLVGGGLIFASTFVMNTWTQSFLIMVSAATPMLFDVSYAAARAMVADMSKSNALERALGFAAGRLIALTGGLVAMGVCYYILSLDLDDYRPVWLAHCGVSLLMAVTVAIVLRETLQKDPDAAGPSGDENAPAAVPKQAPSHRTMAMAVREMCQQIVQASWLLWEDPLLGNFTIMASTIQGIAMGVGITSAGYLLEALRYTQAMTQIPGTVAPLVGLVSTCLCPHMVRRWGAHLTTEFGFLLCTIGFALLGLSALYVRGREALFWLGLLIMSFGSSFPSVCMLSIMSIRVDACSQGKLDSLSQIGGLLGGLLGAYVWTHHLYAGWPVGLIFWPAAGILLICMVWFRVACRLWPNPPARPAVPAKTSV